MRKRLISVLTAAVLVATACSSSTATPSPTTAPAPTTTTPTAAPVATSAAPGASPTAFTVGLTGSTYQATPATTTGGSIVVAEWQFPDTLNPYFAQAETDIEASGSMFDGLLTVTPDLKYAPDLASNVPTVDNGGVVLKGAGMDVTWNLKPGMKWSDGQPINCDDVKATWQWIMDPANTGLAGGTVGWENITGVDGGTGTTCVVHFGSDLRGLPEPDLPGAPGPLHLDRLGRGCPDQAVPARQRLQRRLQRPVHPDRPQDRRPDHPQAEPELADHRRSCAVPRLGHPEVLRRCRDDDRRLPGR